MNIKSSFLLDSETEKEEIFNVKSALSIVKNRHRRKCNALRYHIAREDEDGSTRVKISGQQKLVNPGKMYSIYNSKLP
jgi:hypothetical protein